MMKLPFLLLMMFLSSCVLQKTNNEEFKRCLGEKNLTAMEVLTASYVSFIKSNYEETDMEVGANKFMNDLIDGGSPPIDSVDYVKTAEFLEASGFYNEFETAQGEFQLNGKFNTCIRSISKRPDIVDYTHAKEVAGTATYRVMIGSYYNEIAKGDFDDLTYRYVFLLEVYWSYARQNR